MMTAGVFRPAINAQKWRDKSEESFSDIKLLSFPHTVLEMYGNTQLIIS